MAVKKIPDGYHTVTPYLIIGGAAKALEFYQKAFDAQERLRLDTPQGTIAHAEFQVGDSIVMLADEHPEMGHQGPKTLGGTPVGLALYVEDVDKVYKQAIAAGATEVRPVQDQFYGDRSGTFLDPFGHQWTVATHVEDVTPEEIERRFAEMCAGQPGG
jgi:PhnB protein